MPFTKPYPPTEIDYQDWNDLVDYYAGKTVTKIVDLNGKGDYSTIQEAVDALPTTDAGEILVKGGEHFLSKAVLAKDREDLVIRGVGGATRLKVANKVQERAQVQVGHLEYRTIDTIAYDNRRTTSPSFFLKPLRC